MCRFNRVIVVIFLRETSFNTSYVSVQYTSCDRVCGFFHVSIHRMCRFNGRVASDIAPGMVFQYIVCVGSILSYYAPISSIVSFNTSYVSVQSVSGWGVVILFFVSIHRMCRFNEEHCVL